MNYKRAGKATEISMWRTAMLHTNNVVNLLLQTKLNVNSRRGFSAAFECSMWPGLCGTDKAQKRRKKIHSISFLPTPAMWTKDQAKLRYCQCDSISRCGKEKCRFTSDLRPIEINTKPIIITYENYKLSTKLMVTMINVSTCDVDTLNLWARDCVVWNWRVDTGEHPVHCFIARFLQWFLQSQNVAAGSRYNRSDAQTNRRIVLYWLEISFIVSGEKSTSLFT